MANEDPDYLAWLRRRLCQAPQPHTCTPPMVAHHPTHLRHTGHDARKAHDHYGVTLCDGSHKALHGLAPNGPFAKCRRPDVHAFCEEMAAANRAAYEGRGPGVSLGALAYEVGVVTEAAQKVAGRLVVASVSGGKDSTAMSLWLTEQGIEHERVFCDTGWEAAETYEYLREYLPGKLGSITWLRGARQMEELVEHKGMFPQRTRRFCTEELKVKPIMAYIAGRADAGAEVVNTVGIRAAESEARRKLPEWEWSKDFDCDVWRPLIAWTEEDVIGMHTRHGVRPNPLYLKGASRVGCYPCIFARKAEVRMIADHAPEQIVRIRKLEERVQTAAFARQEARGEGGLYHPPTFFQAPIRDADGKRLCTPIDEIVEWSRTARGGKQRELFAPGAAEEGCMRWGLCDTGSA